MIPALAALPRAGAQPPRPPSVTADKGSAAFPCTLTPSRRWSIVSHSGDERAAARARSPSPPTPRQTVKVARLDAAGARVTADHRSAAGRACLLLLRPSRLSPPQPMGRDGADELRCRAGGLCVSRCVTGHRAPLPTQPQSMPPGGVTVPLRSPAEVDITLTAILSARFTADPYGLRPWPVISFRRPRRPLYHPSLPVSSSPLPSC